MLVNYVSFFDALRFVNWLHNGQPTGSVLVRVCREGPLFQQVQVLSR